MPQIVPTVGRNVLCHGMSPAGVIPGVIVHAWGDTPEALINVHALGDGGNEPMYQAMMSVRIYNADEVPPDAGEKYCTWMPYQVGQAAKTEAAVGLTEARLREIVHEELFAQSVAERAIRASDKLTPSAVPVSSDAKVSD